MSRTSSPYCVHQLFTARCDFGYTRNIKRANKQQNALKRPKTLDVSYFIYALICIPPESKQFRQMEIECRSVCETELKLLFLIDAEYKTVLRSEIMGN